MSTPEQAEKTVILIVGMGRSGTSALTRVLSLCGCNLPNSILGPSDINSRGMWEPADIMKVHLEFLFRHGSVFGDPTMRLQDEIAIDNKEERDYVTSIQSFLDDCPANRPTVIKQPAISEVMTLWLEAARRSRCTVKVIIPVRHPREVHASINAFMKERPMSAELANAVWMKRNLLAELHSRELSRIFVEYHNVLEDWRREISRISRTLAVDLTPNGDAVDSFLTKDLHHQRCSQPISETFGYSWLTRVYAIVSAAAKDGAIDFHALDEIYNAYRSSERAFRIAWDDYRLRFDQASLEYVSEYLQRSLIMNVGQD